MAANVVLTLVTLSADGRTRRNVVRHRGDREMGAAEPLKVNLAPTDADFRALLPRDDV